MLAYGRQFSVRGGQIEELPTPGKGNQPGQHEKVQVPVDHPCPHSRSCLECTAAEICQDCYEPVTACRTCNVIQKCPLFNHTVRRKKR